MASPERCPTCDTAVPEGAERCPGCGRVFGEANRCPHCHAVAAVIRRRGTTVCAACGKPRAGTVLLGGGASDSIVPSSPRGRQASTSAMLTRSRGRAQRGFGIVALGGGVLTAILAAMVVPGAVGLGLALAFGLVGVGLGALSIRAGARSMEKARGETQQAQATAVLELAAEEGGRLTATDVARRFGVSVDEADALLTSMVGDGSKVGVDVDDDGVVRYVFHELEAPRARVRVSVEEAEPEELEVEAGTSEVESDAERRSR